MKEIRTTPTSMTTKTLGLFLAAVAGLAISVFFVWQEPLLKRRSQIHQTFLAALALAVVWWLAYWNLLA